MAGVGLVVLAGVAAMVDGELERRADLQRTGIRESGMVTDVGYARRGDSVVVEFEWRGERRERIYVAEGSRYDVGDRVTVLIDQDDADRVSLLGEDNYHPWAVGLTIAAATIGEPKIGSRCDWVLSLCGRPHGRSAW